MLRIVKLIVFLELLISCSTNEQHEFHYANTNAPSFDFDSIVVEGFHEGFWVNEVSLEVITDGDLNYNSEWNSIKTYFESGMPKLLVNDPLGTDTFDLHYTNSGYNFSRKEDSLNTIQLVRFNTQESLLYTINNVTTKYVSIDSGRVIYDYFFSGNYTVRHLNNKTTIVLEPSGTVVGWDGATAYASHTNMEKPLFLLKNGDSIVDVYYIQDNPKGFNLFELINVHPVQRPDEIIEIGSLSYQFEKW